MANDVEVRSLLLKVDASVELLRRNLADAGATLDNFTKKGEGAATRFDASMKRVNASSGQMRAGFQQLSFQLSDVATQLGSGANGLQIFAQQSGQVVQAIGLMTGGSRGFIGLLGGPWGLALTSAITLLLSFKGKSDEAAGAQKRVAAEAGSAASITQSTLAGLSTAFDPFIDSVNRAIGKLSQFKLYLAQELNSQTIANLQFLDRASGVANSVLPFLPGSLGTPNRLPTDRLSRFNRGFAADQAAQARNRALDAEDARQTAILGGLGFARFSPGGSTAADALKFRDFTPPNPRKPRQPRKPKAVTDPFASIVQDAYDALNDVKFDTLDPNKASADASRKLYNSLGLNPSQDLKAIFEEIDKRKDARLAGIQEEAAKRLELFHKEGEQIRTLAGLYTDAFQGGTKAIFRDFKQIGLQVIAELLARFTIAQFSGGKFDFGSALATTVSHVLPGFANGGTPPVGRASIVGERGPELFIPKVSGTIIPNHKLSAGLVFAPTINAPGATAETVSMIRRELANAAPAIIQAAQRTTIQSIQRPRL
jgi:hypothetical protein